MMGVFVQLLAIIGGAILGGFVGTLIGHISWKIANIIVGDRPLLILLLSFVIAFSAVALIVYGFFLITY